MSSDNIKGKVIYSDEVLSFVALVQQYCMLVEESDNYLNKDYFERLHKILSNVYASAALIPSVENVSEDSTEKFVTEVDYNILNNKLKLKFGQYDAYLEVFNPQFAESEQPVLTSLAEGICDLYQSLKDFITLYEVGSEDVMNDAIWEVKQDFETFWGQKAINILGAIHYILYSGEEITDEQNDELPGVEDDIRDKSDWIISRRMRDYSDEE